MRANGITPERDEEITRARRVALRREREGLGLYHAEFQTPANPSIRYLACTTRLLGGAGTSI